MDADKKQMIFYGKYTQMSIQILYFLPFEGEDQR
jgi:hypothetical protein